MKDTLSISEVQDLLDTTHQNIWQMLNRDVLTGSRKESEQTNPLADWAWQVDKKSVLTYAKQRLDYHTKKVSTLQAAVKTLGGK